MARITVEDCLKQTGHENRFSLIHLALERVKQHRNGLPLLVEGKNKEIVMTLREIAAGMVSKENIHDFEKEEEPEEVMEAAEENAGEETAEAASEAPATEAAPEAPAQEAAAEAPAAESAETSEAAPAEAAPQDEKSE